MTDVKIVTTAPVLVTGASGFVAAHVIKQLLEAGYKVRGTVRKVDKSKYKALYDLDKSGEQLELVAANLTDEGSYDSAVVGCEYVMHIASPYVLNVTDPQKDLVDPAVNGTINVLRSCTKSGAVKRVVLTSSVAAITDAPVNDHVYTERDWNATSTLERNPYYYSKRLAEEAAWKYVEDNKQTFDLVVVNPYLVIGPELFVPENAEGLNTSNHVFSDMITGKYPAIMSLAWGMVDVRDVARAHLVVMEEPEAKGRHICCNQTLAMRDIVDKLKARYTETKLPSTNLACGTGNFLVLMGSYFQDRGTATYLRTNLNTFPKYNNSKLKGYSSHHFDYRPIEETMYDLCDWMMDNHLIAGKRKPAGGEEKKHS